ncbi:MAG TPA: type II secretion system protein GspL [Usitatibacter sp.]
MRLRVFLPRNDSPDATFAWMLMDARGFVLREDRTTLDMVPRAEQREAVVPASRVLFARLKLPKVSQATIRELLPFAVEDRLLADPSHIHAVAGEKSAAGDTLVAVVDREWLRAMLRALDDAGLTVSSAWPEGDLLPRGEWHVVWSIKQGMLVDDDGAAATFDHDASNAFPLSLRLAVDEAGARGTKPAAVRVHVEGDAALPDLAAWSAESGVKFSAGSRWEELVKGEPNRSRFELLQGDFLPRGRSLPKIPRAVAALAAVIALLQVGFVALDAWRLERERTSLEAERESIFRTAFPEAKVVVDPDLQMSRNLADLKRSHGVVVEDDFLVRLTRAAKESTGTAKSIEYSSGKLIVRRGDGPVAEAAR